MAKQKQWIYVQVWEGEAPEPAEAIAFIHAQVSADTYQDAMELGAVALDDMDPYDGNGYRLNDHAIEIVGI